MKRSRKPLTSKASARAEHKSPPEVAAPRRAIKPLDHALLGVVVAAAFARGLFTPLQTSWDDGRFLLDNPLVQAVSWDNFVAIVTARHFEAYHPLHLLSYWLDVPWFGVDPLALHVTNLLLWILAGSVLLRVMVGFGLSRMPAFYATALCLVHPVQVEVVTWATGRKDVLALLFCALAVRCHQRSERFADRHAWLSRCAFLLGALSKTSVAALPLFLIAADVLWKRRTLRHAVMQQVPALLLTTGLGVVTFVTWQANDMLRTSSATEPAFFWRWSTTVTHQLATALWPSSNSPMYATHDWARAALSALVGPLLLSIGIWRAMAAERRVLALGLFGFALMLLPESNLIPMVFPLQDRYVSLALVPLSLGVGTLLERPPLVTGMPGVTARLLVGLALLATIAARTVQYQAAWDSERALWTHAVSVQPRAFYGWMKLGEVRRNETDLAGSVAAYQHMVELVPSLEVGHLALFHARVLLDEQKDGLAPSIPMDLARRFRAGTHDAAQLHQLSQELIARGYNEAAAMALDYALTLKSFPNNVLADNAARFEQAHRPAIARVLRRHEKQNARQH